MTNFFRHLPGAPGIRAVLAGCLALLAGACACSGTQIDPPANPITDPQILLAHMQSRLDDLDSARIQAVGEFYGGDLRGANVHIVVLVRQPSDLHVQVLDPIGNALQSLFCNGESLALYDLAEEVYYHGSPTPQNIARVLPFYMSARDIVRVMLGGAPLDMVDGDAARYTLDWDGEQGSYRLSMPLAHEPGRLVLWVRDGEWVVEAGQRFDDSDTMTLDLRTGDFSDEGGALLPRQLRLLLYGDAEIDMSLDIESVEVNVELPDELFFLEPPRGVRQVALDQ